MPDRFVPPDSGLVRRVVVLQLYFLGDTLLATPAIRALAGRFPGARIEVVVKRRSRAALERNPHAGLLTDYDPPNLLQRPAHWLSLRRRWRAEGVDLCVDLTADGRSARLLGAMQPDLAVGFHSGRTAALVAGGISKSCGERHVARHMLDLVGCVGAEGDSALEFHCSPGALAAAGEWAAADPASIVALHPGGNRTLRRWKLPRWIELARELRGRGMRLWSLGGRGERDLTRALVPEGVEDTASALTLDEAAARLARSALFIGNDSGPMHLAAAVGTPALSLFGPSLPSTVAPQGSGHRYLHERLECCPCDQRRCVRPEDFCLDRIPVARVLENALSMLGRGPGGDR